MEAMAVTEVVDMEEVATEVDMITMEVVDMDGTRSSSLFR